MIESRISDRVAYNFQADPNYSTRIKRKANGWQKRNINWTRAKRYYRALYQRFEPEDFEDLQAAYHVCHGAAIAFRFRDWTDFKIVGGSLGDSPGIFSPVQLFKRYSFGGEYVDRIITKPNLEGFQMYEDGVPKAGTLDTTTGIFIPETEWTGMLPLTVDVEFDVPVHFMNDSFPGTYEEFKAVSVNVVLEEVFGE